MIGERFRRKKFLSMIEIYKILLTSSLTVIGGVIVFVIGQLIVKFLIEPLQEQAKLIGEIANSLILYSNVGGNVEPHYYEGLKKANELEEPIKKVTMERYEKILNNHWEKSDNTSDILRHQASRLMGVTNSIPLYNFWASLRFVPKRQNILLASTQLIGMSNSTHGQQSFSERIKQISELLEIDIVSERFGYKSK